MPPAREPAPSHPKNCVSVPYFGFRYFCHIRRTTVVAVVSGQFLSDLCGRAFRAEHLYKDQISYAPNQIRSFLAVLSDQVLEPQLLLYITPPWCDKNQLTDASLFIYSKSIAHPEPVQLPLGDYSLLCLKKGTLEGLFWG